MKKQPLVPFTHSANKKISFGSRAAIGNLGGRFYFGTKLRFSVEFSAKMNDAGVRRNFIRFALNFSRKIAPKKLQRSFPHFKKFCATMPIRSNSLNFSRHQRDGLFKRGRASAG